MVFIYSINSLHSQNLQPIKGDNGKWGYMTNGHWAVEPKFDLALMFSENLACVKMHGKYGYIDQYGEIVIRFEYDEAGQFSNGLACVKKLGKWGYVDKKAAVVIPYKYDDAYSYSAHLALVKLGGKYGFINEEGKTIIPFKYDAAKSFSDGLAYVRLGQKQGYIDYYDNWYNDKNEYFPKFKDYAKLYVEEKINKWQEKGKYEKLDDWKRRVNEDSRKDKVDELAREAERYYISKEGRRVRIEQFLGAYDAENEVFLIKDKHFGDLLVPVPIAEAENFEKNFYKTNKTVKYFVDNDTLALAELRYIIDGGRSYAYSNSASLDYFVANLDYEFAPIELDYNPERQMSGSQRIMKSTVKSDVDTNIPRIKGQNDDTYAVIIANENYKYEASVPFAKADGAAFKNYCLNVLSIPEERIEYFEDATLGEIRRSLKYLENASLSRGGNARVIFYYSGHGIPNESTKTAYLLPCDGTGTDTETGYDLAQLYSRLGNMPVKSAVVFLDACFSGAKREGDMILSSKSVVITPNETLPLNGNVVVFAASDGNQTAMQYETKGHGLFTYYLLKKLKDTRGQTSLGELFEYVSEEVGKAAIDINRKPQNPTVSYSPYMHDTWKGIKLR